MRDGASNVGDQIIDLLIAEKAVPFVHRCQLSALSNRDFQFEITFDAGKIFVKVGGLPREFRCLWSLPVQHRPVAPETVLFVERRPLIGVAGAFLGSDRCADHDCQPTHEER